MQKDTYNVVIEDSVYVIIEDENVSSCKYLGTVNKLIKRYNQKRNHKRVSLK